VHPRKLIPIALLLLSCSGLNTLTPAMLEEAEQRWNTAKPASYSLKVAMQGDRVERGEFDVTVKDNVVTSLKRNGAEVKSVAAGQDYSIDGLFKIVHEEMDLAQNPSVWGAPEGYSAYLMASFDRDTGALKHYRRSVGGISNSIDIEVLEFKRSN